MATKSERMKVEVKESTTDGVRTFCITLNAPAGDFLLTDLLKQRGVIESLDAELKQAVRSATESYLGKAETLIATLATESKPSQKSHPNGTGDGKRGKDKIRIPRPNAEPGTESASATAQGQSNHE